ncbi:MAG: hypothetical protein MUD08_04280 [Cytophagales bacterium]|jgi:hypothetical protein|nr:hypothetical protein [Cytophagales bacterium]
MTKYILSLLITVILYSCIPTQPTEEEKQEALQKAVFDSKITEKLLAYERLKTFLENNAAAIIAYRDSKNVVQVVGTDSTYLMSEDCYTFFQGNPSTDITNVPDSLKTQLTEIYNAIGKQNIESFTVCNDKRISIEAKQDKVQKRLHVVHALVWNTKQWTEVYERSKDTMLNGNCIYRLGLHEEVGY